MKQRLLLSTAILFLAAAMPAQAQLFGPSDEQVAHENAQDAQLRSSAQAIEQNRQEAVQAQQQLQTQIRDLGDRIRNLTDSLARATGANEELGFQIGQLNGKIEQQSRDFSYRLCVISAQQLGADPNGLNCAATGAGGGAPQRSGAPMTLAPGSSLPPIMPNSALPPPAGGNPNMGRGPGTLGTLSSPGPAPAMSGGGGADGREFDNAMNLLARAQYNEASAAFRTYADSHADDPDLAPQALYWVGNIAYMQQDYPGAARVFAEQIKKYPKSPRGADSMLKMGQALAAQGQTRNACTAFAAIRKQYPDASPSTVTAVANARRAANCA
jgi:tol-pal system protein YbgF